MATITNRRTEPHVGQFIDSLDPGGAEEVVINLARRLEENGYRVTIFHFGNEWLSENADRFGLSHHKLGGAKYYRSKISVFLFILMFRRVLRALDIDLLHSHLMGAVFAGAVTSKLAGIPSLGTLHDTYSLDESAYSRAMLRAAYKLNCRLYVVAEQMRSVMSAKTGLNHEAFEVVYNGIDLPDDPQPRSQTPGPRTVRLVCVARLIPIKRLDLTLHALARISVDRDWELWIVGDGPERKRLEIVATDLGIASRVQFFGFRQDVFEILVNADIFLLSSDSEGLSVSIIESMAAGLPAIVSNVGGNSELVVSRKTGLIFPKGDSDAMAASIRELIMNDGLRQKLARNSFHRAHELFSSGRMADLYAIEYENNLA